MNVLWLEDGGVSIQLRGGERRMLLAILDSFSVRDPRGEFGQKLAGQIVQARHRQAERMSDTEGTDS